MFINVKIDNLNEVSKLILLKVNNEVNINRDKKNINIVKKYLFISLKSKLIFVKINLLINMFLGLLKDKIWFREYLNKENIFINLKPELVEKKEPPIITNIKNTKFKLVFSELSENPILDILLQIDKKLSKKLLLKLKKRKNIDIKITKYTIKCRSS